MKRLGSSDSLGALISICPSSDDQKTSSNSNTVYSRGFQSLLEGLEEEDCSLEEEQGGGGGGGGGGGQKKRRLSVDQVKALEKNFEVENKLEPDRKVKLAHELGLQPRQVAVWFQNRRARWKTKQLERDYGILKSNFDSLKQDFQALQQDKEALLTELRELKSKIHGEEIESTNHSIEEEKKLKSEPEKISLMNETTCYNNNNGGGGGIRGVSVFGDGSSDSDSSAILNEEININNSPISSSGGGGGGGGGGVLHQQLLNNMSPPQLPLLPHALSFNCSSSSSPSSINCFQFSDSRGISTNTLSDFQHQQQSQPFVRMEEHNFFGAEEVTCNFFSDEQAPTLQWCQDPWN